MCISWGSRETEPRLDRHNKRASNKIYFKELAHMATRPGKSDILGEPSRLETQAGILCDRIKAEFLSQEILCFCFN